MAFTFRYIERVGASVNQGRFAVGHAYERVEWREAGLAVIDGVALDLREGSAETGRIMAGGWRSEGELALPGGATGYELPGAILTRTSEDDFDLLIVNHPNALRGIAGQTITSFPAYPLWPAGETQGAQEIESTHPVGFPRLSGAALKATNLADWTGRIAAMAVAFEAGDDAQRWAAEEAHGTRAAPNVAAGLDPSVAADQPYIRKADNTAIHWPKMVGLCWRAIGYYRRAEADGTRDAADAMGLPSSIDLATGDGIEALVAKAETEFALGGAERPVYAWHYAAGANEGEWTAYYGARQVWTTNVGTGLGSELIYTAADAADWGDLYSQFKAALATTD